VLTADIRHAVWAAAQDAAAAGELPAIILADRGPADPSTLRPAGPGGYVSTLPYLLATPATPPRPSAPSPCTPAAAPRRRYRRRRAPGSSSSQARPGG